MNWTEQSTKMMNNWLESQQQMWQGWLNQMPSTTPAFEAWNDMTQATMDVWQSYWQQASQPWQQFQEKNGGDSAVFNPFANPFYDTFQKAVGQWLETPALGVTREAEEKVRQAMKMWQEVQQAGLEYQAVLAEGWSLAFQRIQTAVMARGQEGKPIDSLTDLANLWSETADPAFLELFHSEKFIRTQGKLNTAVMKYRIQQRELIEQFSQLFDIPTRTEVDAAHKANYHQHKEIKALKKELQTLRMEMAALQETVAKLNKPARKRSARKKAAETTPPKQEE